MVKLSASRAWEETTAFLKRSGGLVFTVALAFMALPSILAAPWLAPIMQRMMAQQPLTPDELGVVVPVFILLLTVSLLGTLAIYVLALRTGVSVGEALGHALRRLLPAIAVLLLIGLAIALLGIALSIPLALIGAGRQADPNALSGILALLLVPVIIYVFARLYLAQLAVVDGHGPVSALRASWRMTKGNVGRLIALLLVALIVGLVVWMAGTFIVAGLLGALGRALGGQAVGDLLAAAVTNSLSAIISAVVAVLVAAVYRQLAGGGAPASVPPADATGV